MLGDLNFVILHVRDVAAARTFYTNALELAVAAENPTFVQLQAAGGATLALQHDELAAPTGTIELWWQMQDVDSACAQLQARGVEIVSGPADQPFGRTLSIKDPEGNVLAMYQPRPA
jgi:predicted enzyme related to lactoylglutathione lyase